MSNELDHQPKGATGRWTKQQHERFLQGLELFGRNWKEISKHVGTRNGAQIRSHAQKYFDRIQKVGEHKSGSLEAAGERLSSSSELTSAPEQETNMTHSYFFSQISKFVAESTALSFWGELFDVENRNSFTNSEADSDRFKKSFTLYRVNQKVNEEISQTSIENIQI